MYLWRLSFFYSPLGCFPCLEPTTELPAVPDKTELIESLLADRILVLDGAMGTQIQALGLNERAVRGERIGTRRVDPIETIPKSLRREALRREAPEREQDAPAIPIGDFGFGAGLANAVNRGQ